LNCSRKLLTVIILSLLLGLLTACDPGAYCYLSVYRVNVAENVPYITARERLSWGLGACPTNGDHYFTSTDEGQTWQELTALPFQLASQDETIATASVTACLPDQERTCYRISRGEQVDISSDGGKTWKVDWKQPNYRNGYMQRNPYISRLLDVTPDTVPFDLGITQEGPQYTVYVAMGNQGVLVKSPEGKWERYEVVSSEIPVAARPLPFSATSVKEIQQAIHYEINWTLFSAAIYFIILSILNWRFIQSNSSASALKIKGLFLLPFIIGLVGMVLYGVFIFVGSFLMLGNLYMYYEKIYQIISQVFSFTDPLALVCWIPIIGLLLSWLWFVLTSKNIKINANIAILTACYPLGTIVLTLIPFILWTVGLIPNYQVSLVLSIFFGSCITIFGFVSRKRNPIHSLLQSNNR
jgi:hypothetical protein